MPPKPKAKPSPKGKAGEAKDQAAGKPEQTASKEQPPPKKELPSPKNQLPSPKRSDASPLPSASSGPGSASMEGSRMRQRKMSTAEEIEMDMDIVSTASATLGSRPADIGDLEIDEEIGMEGGEGSFYGKSSGPSVADQILANAVESPVRKVKRTKSVGCDEINEDIRPLTEEMYVRLGSGHRATLDLLLYEKLYTGATGELYKGVAEGYSINGEPVLPQIVAVQRIDLAVKGDDLGAIGCSLSLDLLRILRKELTQVTKIRHPNLVEYLHFSKVGNSFFVAMKMVAGGNVASFATTHRPITEETAQLLSIHVLGALKALHANELNHGNITSRRILFGKNFSDMEGPGGQGISFYLSSFATTYCATLQGRNMVNRPLSLKFSKELAAFDTYRLGCILTELLSGSSKQTEEKSGEIISEERPRPVIPDTLSPEAASFIESLVDGCTAEHALRHQWLDRGRKGVKDPQRSVILEPHDETVDMTQTIHKGMNTLGAELERYRHVLDERVAGGGKTNDSFTNKTRVIPSLPTQGLSLEKSESMAPTSGRVAQKRIVSVKMAGQ